MDGAESIAFERRRQLNAEGWSASHDDTHRDGELSAGAMGYLQSALSQIRNPPLKLTHPPAFWPWDVRWWKPRSRRADLVRAGALIAAEIDRLDRIADNTTE